jgi:diacylglycerol kinase family enzyme
MIKAIFDLTTGHFERNEQFTSHEVSRLEITSDLPMRIHMDGEAFYFDSVKIEILPKSVRFFAPRGMYFLDYSVLMNRNKKGGGWE